VEFGVVLAAPLGVAIVAPVLIAATHADVVVSVLAAPLGVAIVAPVLIAATHADVVVSVLAAVNVTAGTIPNLMWL